MADTVRHHVNSYKDLPLALYQIQWKFRHELRAKSGLNRGREFLMKDLYSFHTSPEDCNVYYERVKEAYLRIFRRLGLEARVVEASGGAFTKEYSHEFQVFSEFGEDHILYCGSCSFAQNKEIATVKSGDACPACSNGVVEESRGVEVGNIFRLGTKYSEPLNALYVDADGNRKPIIMACYGIGVSRLMGTIIDVHHDDRGMLWPDEVAPFDVHVLCLGSDSSRLQQADELCEALAKAGFQVLLDDRQNSAGASLADADLLGIPVRLILSDKTKGSVEYKRRFEKTAQLLTSSEVLRHLMKDKESHAR
jgi:prolyl-tRNA synthetase